MSAATAQLPPLLSGLRVIEMGRTAATGFCGKLLAEMGLDVVIVEPNEGHNLRTAAPCAKLKTGETVSALWLYLAGGKRSIALDLQDAADRAVLDNLVAAADLVIHDLPERAARNENLAFETLRAIRPGIVVATITPFGNTGPYADATCERPVGLCARRPSLRHRFGRSRTFAPVTATSLHFSPAYLAATTALASLLRTRHDGVARFVEISQQEALTGALDTTVNRYTYAGVTRTRHGNRIQERSPLTDIYRTKDGYFLICVYTEVQWRAFCAMLDRIDWLENPALATLAGRVANGSMIEAAMNAWFGARTSHEALADCQRYRLPSCIASAVPELLRDPQLLARDHFAKVDYGVAGMLEFPEAALSDFVLCLQGSAASAAWRAWRRDPCELASAPSRSGGDDVRRCLGLAACRHSRA